MHMNNFNSNSIINNASQNKENMGVFYLIIFYLFFEFVRPQLIFPALKILHLPAITVILLAVSLLFSKKLYFNDRQTIIFIILLVEMGIHGPTARNNYWTFQVFYSMAIIFVAFIAISNIIDTQYKYKILIKSWLLIFSFLAIWGYFHAELHLPKSQRYGMGVGGFLGDSNDFSMAFNMVLPFALFGVFSAKEKTSKICFILLTCLFMLVVILSESRGGFLGMASVAIYCWLRSNKKIALGILMVLLVIFALVAAPPSYWDEIRSISAEQSNPYGTGAQRIYSWKLGWQMFLDNPIIGVGQGNYPWYIVDTENELGLIWKARSLGGRAAHSLYFTLLSELGLLGAILFLAMLIFSITDLRFIKKVTRNFGGVFVNDEAKKAYYMALALEGSLIGFLTSSVFISTLYYPNFWILCGFILSLKKIVSVKISNLKHVSIGAAI